MFAVTTRNQIRRGMHYCIGFHEVIERVAARITWYTLHVEHRSRAIIYESWNERCKEQAEDERGRFGDVEAQ